MLTTLKQLNFLLTRQERREGIALFVAMLAGAALEVVGVGAIPLYVAAVSKPERLYSLGYVRRVLAAFGAPTQAELIVWLGIALVSLFVVKNVYFATLTRLQAGFAARRQVSISTRLYRAYLYSPYSFHLQRNTSALLRNIDHEAVTIATALFQVISFLQEVSALAMIMGLLLVVEPAVTAMAGVLFGGSIFVFHRLTRSKANQMARHEQYHHAETIRAVNQGLGGIKDVIVLGRERYFAGVFARSARERAGAGVYRTVFTALPRLFIETIGVVGMFGATMLLYAGGRSPELIVPTLALLAVALVRVMPSFQRMANALATLRWGEMSLGVVYHDLTTLEAEATLTSSSSEERAEIANWQTIRLTDVAYQYPGSSTPALTAITMEIQRGTAIGLVGISGAGKSTLVDLLLGLMEPTSGRVAADDTSITLNPRGWRRQIGYISQQIFLTDDTIRRNVAFGLEDDAIDEASVTRAVTASQLGDFVASLPEGLNTIVGERGVRLSGGQRQRIGIARALYHDPALLIMDEATSALDNRTERYIVEALDALRGRYTLVVIAHRMSTVKNCDRLYVLKDGRLVAQGTFADLLQSNQDFKAISA